MLRDFFSPKTVYATEVPSRSAVACAFEQVLAHSWWVALFLIICYATYEQAYKKYKVDYDQLSQQLSQLLEDKERALVAQQDLILQINSQSDPAWMELTLMKVLGVVPEGHTKIFFLPEEKSSANVNHNHPMIP